LTRSTLPLKTATALSSCSWGVANVTQVHAKQGEGCNACAKPIKRRAGTSHRILAFTVILLQINVIQVNYAFPLVTIYGVPNDLSKIFGGLANRFEAFRPKILSELAKVFG
jgi:hypothetical protein